jgi:voltage-gated potassium channel
MLVLSLAAVPSLILSLVVDLPHSLNTTFFIVDLVVWAAFAVEYVIRMYLAPYKGAFVRHNVIDLVIIALPFLRPLRVVRSARALRLLRSGRAVAFMARGERSAKDVLTRHGLHYALLVGGILIIAGALLVREFESGVRGSTIHSFGDAIWWALATVSTVGFGDKYPVTEGGRAVAVVLMFFGVGLFGLIAASLASVFLRKEREQEVDPMVAEALERLERIENALADLGTSKESSVDAKLDDEAVPGRSRAASPQS